MSASVRSNMCVIYAVVTGMCVCGDVEWTLETSMASYLHLKLQ